MSFCLKKTCLVFFVSLLPYMFTTLDLFVDLITFMFLCVMVWKYIFYFYFQFFGGPANRGHTEPPVWHYFRYDINEMLWFLCRNLTSKKMSSCMMTLTLKKILHPVSVLSWDFRLNCCVLNIGTVTVYLVAAVKFILAVQFIFTLIIMV